MTNICQNCGEHFEDYDYLCDDDVCVKCHGGLEKFLECGMRHFFLMTTQCNNLMFKTPIRTDEDYNKAIEDITTWSMGRVREFIPIIRKWRDEDE